MFISINLILRFLVGIGVIIIFIITVNFLFPLPDKIEYSTIITDSRNEVIHAFLTSDQKWRMKTELVEISPLLQKTIVQKEDKYFYYHPGVNVLAVCRAAIKNIFRLKRTSGASTITMQVARALEPKKRTWWNKGVEVFRAFQLEWKYSKQEILQLYLNLIPFGGNIEGVKSAAFLYFKKSPDHLSLAEITALSIIPNRPSSLVIGKDNNRIMNARNRWLKQFAREQIFTQKEIADALNEPLTAVRGTVPALLPQLSYTLKKTGNDIIRTNIERNTQLKTEKLVKDYVRSLYVKNIRNAAVVIIDNTSHKVISYIGSADFRDSVDGGQVNGAAAIRQPGSTLKPLLYGLCIDEGLMTPKMVITDVAVNFNGYAPENYDRNFNGYVTLEYALEHSLNIPAVKSLRLLKTDRLVQSLANCNFQQIKKDQHKLGLSMILGGCGASLEELTGLYSAFATEGVYIKPSFLQQDTVQRSTRILSAAAAYMINDIMSKVNRPDFPLTWQSTERMPRIAWKTGTSYGRRDAWSIGYNRNYTIGVWIGNFSGLGIPELSGADIATPLLFKVFNTLDYDTDAAWFRQPEDCDMRKICSETGLLPDDHCSHVVMDYFIPLVSSAKKCTNVEEIIVSADEKLSYCKSCMPESGYKKRKYKIISPEMKSYFNDNRITYDKIPPHYGDCDKIFKEGSPVIISPSHDAEYLISKRTLNPCNLWQM